MKAIIKSILGQNLINRISVLIFGDDLEKLAQIFNTDKFGKHDYTPIYTEVFHKLRARKLSILEIGVGGYDDPNEGGASLKMWKRYFYNSHIYAIDIYDKSNLNEDRITIFQGSQDDELFLNKVTAQMGPLDIIIDDGSHINEHVIKSFEILFPKLKDGGIYVVEDTQTAYWPDYGGNSENLNTPNTSMNFFKSLTDGINSEEYINDNYTKTYFDKTIESIRFYHNMIFIFKKPLEDQ